MAKKSRRAKRSTKAGKRRPSTKRKSRTKPTTVRLTGVEARGEAGGVGTALGVGAATVSTTGNASARDAIQVVTSQHAALQSTRGVTEPPPAAVVAPQGGEAHLGATSSLRADTTLIPAPVPITPTVYPDSPQGAIIVQNYITINAESVEYKNFNIKMDALIKQLQIGGSNEISGDVCNQLLSEMTAGRELLKGPKPSRDLIDLLLVRPLKWLAEKAAGAIIGTYAGLALDALLKMIM
jgi:hypothetical protein